MTAFLYRHCRSVLAALVLVSLSWLAEGEAVEEERFCADSSGHIILKESSKRACDEWLSEQEFRDGVLIYRTVRGETWLGLTPRILKVEEGTAPDVRLDFPGEIRSLFLENVSTPTGSRWGISGLRLKESLSLRLPGGDWSFETLDTDGRRWRASASAGKERAVVESREWQRVPIVSGVVLVGDGEFPAIGAMIFVDEELATRTDGRGEFTLELEPREHTLRVEYPNYLHATSLVAPGTADRRLPPIRMHVGASIEVTLLVAESESESEKQWALFVDDGSGDTSDRTEIQTGVLQPGINDFLIERVPPGRYGLVLSGSDPLEMLEEKLSIGTASTYTAELELVPGLVEISVKRGSEPMARADLQVLGEWTGSLVLDEDGNASSRTWDSSDVMVVVMHPGLTLPFTILERVGEGERSWQLEIPETSIVGRVDDEKGELVGGATVRVEASDGNLKTSLSTVTDLDGDYEVNGLWTNRVEISVDADGYPSGTARLVELSEGQENRVDITIPTGRVFEVRVSDTFGFAVSGASVLAMVGELEVALAATDREGRVELNLPPSVTDFVDVYVVHPDGRFSLSMQQRAVDEKGPVVILPPSVADLVMSVVDQKRAGIANVPFSLRVGTIVLPRRVISAMRRVQGRSFSTDENGLLALYNLPAGSYQLIPGREGTSSVAAPYVELVRGTHRMEMVLERIN